jgi:hypothetical protein
MADDTNFRSFRPADQRWPSQGNSAGGSREGDNDPLAELARLIGQTDPFGELNKVPPRPAAPAPQANPAAPAPHPRAAQPRVAQPPIPASADPYGAPLSFGRQQTGARGQDQQQAFQPAYDPAIYGSPQQASGHPSEAYSDDPSLAAEADEHYEDDEYADERPRRRGLKIFVAVAALAVIGAGGAWGYRALFKNGVSGPPPVIKANTTPSKIAAAPASTKQINDRVGDAPQEERVVSREETPVDIKDTSRPAPRMVFPGVPTSPNAPDANAVAAAAPPAASNPPGPAWAEPKKIRTVTIRPDQMGNAAAPTQVSRQNAAPSQSAAATPPVSPQPAPTPQRPAPAAQNNAPLSLSPQVASAEASAPRPAVQPVPAPAAPTRVASAPPAAEAPTTASTTGRYTVQISSQRSENEAHASFRSLQAKFPSLLGDRQPIVRRADLGDKGIYFRAMVGPFASVEQATQFCGSLKSAGGQCVVQRN